MEKGIVTHVPTEKDPAQLESTREEILDTALAILQESGLEAITSRWL